SGAGWGSGGRECRIIVPPSMFRPRLLWMNHCGCRVQSLCFDWDGARRSADNSPSRRRWCRFICADLRPRKSGSAVSSRLNDRRGQQARDGRAEHVEEEDDQLVQGEEKAREADLNRKEGRLIAAG